MIRKLLLLGLAAMVALLAIGDIAAKHFAETQIASQVRKHTTGVVGVKASISSFPFLGHLIVQGKVPKLDLAMTDVSGHGIDVARLDVVAKNIVLDRTALTGGEHVKIKGLDSMTVTAVISEATIRAMTHADVHLLDGKATLTLLGRTVDAGVSVQGKGVRIAVTPQLGTTVPLPDTNLLPCQVAVRVVPGALQLSCTATTLPQLVIDAVGAVDLRH